MWLGHSCRELIVWCCVPPCISRYPYLFRPFVLPFLLHLPMRPASQSSSFLAAASLAGCRLSVPRPPGGLGIIARATSQPIIEPRCGLAGRLQAECAAAARWSVVSLRRRPTSHSSSLLAAASPAGCRLSVPRQPGGPWYHGGGGQPWHPSLPVTSEWRRALRISRRRRCLQPLRRKLCCPRQPSGLWCHGEGDQSANHRAISPRPRWHAVG